MNLPKGTNINTWVTAAGFVLVVAGIIWSDGRAAEKQEQTTAALAAYKVATDSRISQLETTTRQIDNLAFRLQAQENANASIGRGLDEVQSAVASQSGDIRVIREILQRIERQGNGTGSTALR